MGERFKGIVKEWILPFGLLFAVLLLLRTVCFFVVVPTGSMIPTIDEWSVLFAVNVREPDKLERGDIIAFRSEELDTTLVKRLIALPGESVEINDSGHVYIDGEFLSEFYVKNHSRLAGSFQVPEGHYLFMGDNRANSVDARSWEEPYIAAEKVKGKVVFTLWPFTNFGPLR